MKSLNYSEAGPKVSVVIPVYNGSKSIFATVESILKQSLTPHEIIVVDDGSIDNTPEVLKRLGDKIIPLRKPNGGPASARNLGIRTASGEFVAFTDDDCLPDNLWLANLLRGFDGARVAGVGGVVRRFNNGLASEYTDAIRLYDPGVDATGKVTYLATGNACFRRDVLLEAGLFSERFRKPGGEEPDLCMRIKALGYEFRAVEDAVVLHRHFNSISGLLRASINYGEGAYLLGSIWPDYRWKGSARKGLLANFLTLPLALKDSKNYRREHGILKALAYSFLDRARALAITWGYLNGEKRTVKDN